MPDRNLDAFAQLYFGVTTTASAVATWLLNVTLTQLIGTASLISIILHAAYLIWKWRREARGIK